MRPGRSGKLVNGIQFDVTPCGEDDGMKTSYDEHKFTELVLHVAARLQDDHSGGATKLNKVLFFADFAHVRRTGAPITGAAYQKLDHGPAVRRLRPVRDRLVRSAMPKFSMRSSSDIASIASFLVATQTSPCSPRTRSPRSTRCSPILSA